jgi:hypothetical protein
MLDTTGNWQSRASALATHADDTRIEVDTLKWAGHTAQPAVGAFTSGALTSGPGVAGTCPDCEFAAYAAGNLDPDTTMDSWSISTESRLQGGTSVGSGEAVPEEEDL